MSGRSQGVTQGSRRKNCSLFQGERRVQTSFHSPGNALLGDDYQCGHLDNSFRSPGGDSGG